MTVLQTQLKPAPQWGMLGLGILTVLLFFIKAKKLSTVLFAFLLGILLYSNLFVMFDTVCSLLGQHEPLGIAATIFALTATPIMLLLYFKIYPREQVLEKACTIAFLVLTLTVYFAYELF
jgi:hypothetical protein